MKKLSLLCALSFIFSIAQANTVVEVNQVVEVNVIQPQVDFPDKNQIKKLYTMYAASLLASGCVGAVTGSAVRYMEKKLDVPQSSIGLFLFIISWIYEPMVRNEIITAMQTDLDESGIAHKKIRMFRAAWIASWIAYLRA